MRHYIIIIILKKDMLFKWNFVGNMINGQSATKNADANIRSLFDLKIMKQIVSFQRDFL